MLNEENPLVGAVGAGLSFCCSRGVCPRQFRPKNAAQMLQDFDKNNDGLLQLDEFDALVKRFPIVVYP